MSYVAAGYGLTFGVLVLYAGWVLRRGRALRRALRDEHVPDQ